MREVVESERNLKIKQAEVADLIVEDTDEHSAISSQHSAKEDSSEYRVMSTEYSRAKRAVGIKLRDGRTVGAQAVVITTGTFLNGLIHCGEQTYPAGRSGEPPSQLLGESLKLLGFRGSRLKTGTPPPPHALTLACPPFPMHPRA